MSNTLEYLIRNGLISVFQSFNILFNGLIYSIDSRYLDENRLEDSSLIQDLDLPNLRQL